MSVTHTAQRAWSEDQEITLRDHWGFEPARMIAQRLGKTTNAVIGKANRLGLPPIGDELRYEWVRAGYQQWLTQRTD